MDLLIVIGLVFGAFGPIFLLCELGERLTDRFNQIENEIFQCNWYTYPMDIQRMLPIIISETQALFVLSGLGNIQCSREAFKNVIYLFTKFKNKYKNNKQ